MTVFSQELLAPLLQFRQEDLGFPFEIGVTDAIAIAPGGFRGGKSTP
jgi:hypothetical protein